jgi:hypothetical protein
LDWLIQQADFTPKNLIFSNFRGVRAGCAPLDPPLDSDLVVIGLTGIGPIRKIYFCSVTFISITVLVISVIGVIGCTLFGKYLYKRQKSSDKSYQELITLLSANITINSSSSSSSSGLITSYSHPSSRSFHHSSDVKHSTPLKLLDTSEVDDENDFNGVECINLENKERKKLNLYYYNISVHSVENIC